MCRGLSVIAVLLGVGLVGAACADSDGNSENTASTSSSSIEVGPASSGSGPTGSASSALPTSTPSSAAPSVPTTIVAGTPATGAGLSDPPGTVLAAEPMAGPGSGSQGWRIRYASTSIDGDPIEVTGMVFAPAGPTPPAGRPVLAWAHGTTGLADACAPSLDGAAQLALLFGPILDQGYVIAATDYEGLGGPGLHPYLVGESEGRGVLDSVRAAVALPGTGAVERALLWGPSQGGHAALWAGQLAPTYAPELDLLGVVASAPASIGETGDPENEGLAAGRDDLGGFLPMIVAGYAAAYDDVDPAQYLTPAAMDRLGVVDEGCLADVFAAYAGLGVDGILDAEAWNLPTGPVTGPLGGHLIDNQPGNSAIPAPVLIVQGTADTIVPPAGPEAIADRLCALGTVVDFRLYDGADHIGVNLVSLPDVEAFAAARLSGGPPTSTCPPA
jgi:Secretory lipase